MLEPIEPIPECLAPESSTAAKLNEIILRLPLKWDFQGWATINETVDLTEVVFTIFRRRIE